MTISHKFIFKKHLKTLKNIIEMEKKYFCSSKDREFLKVKKWNHSLGLYIEIQSSESVVYLSKIAALDLAKTIINQYCDTKGVSKKSLKSKIAFLTAQNFDMQKDWEDCEKYKKEIELLKKFKY